jgi:hypothetical protein
VGLISPDMNKNEREKSFKKSKIEKEKKKKKKNHQRSLGGRRPPALCRS